MTKLKANLDSSSLGKLIDELKDYQRKFNSLETELPKRLAQLAEREIEDNLNDITEKDGNVNAHAGHTVKGNTATAYLEGSQASYLEFGTGIVGKSHSHPLASEIGWDYLNGERIFQTKDGRIGWIYRSPLTKEYRFTEGIEAGMPVLNAAKTIRSYIPKVAKEILEE